MLSKREHPALPIYRVLLNTHPKTQLPVWRDGYHPDDSLLSKSCPRRKAGGETFGEGATMRAQLQTVRSLHNHVDPVALYRSLSPLDLGRQIQLEKDAVRNIAPESHPKAMFTVLYSDVNFGTTVVDRYKDPNGGIISVRSVDPGTPYADCGSDNGRKPMVTWKVRDKMNPHIVKYAGPPLQVIDKKTKPDNLRCRDVSDPDFSEGDNSSIMENMVYRCLDLNYGLCEVSKSSFLTSTNLLTQLTPEAVVEMLSRDSLHIVPDLTRLLTDRMAERITSDLVRVRTRDRLGGIVEFMDNDHKFTFTKHMSANTQPYHKFVLSFSERTLTVEGVGESFMRDKKEQPILCVKPMRYGIGKQPMEAPYKLKWDGETIMFDFDTDSVKVHRIRSETELIPSVEYENHVRAQLVCECIIVGDTNHIYPFAVVIAGRRFNGVEVAKFMGKATIDLPGYVFHAPVFYDDINEAVLAMVATRYDPLGLVADGVTGTGTGSDVVGKLNETIDIMPCDGALQRWIVEHIAPFAMAYKCNLNNFELCNHRDYSSTGVGPENHSTCGVVEFYISQDVDTVFLSKKCARHDKDESNGRHRLKLVLPTPIQPGQAIKKRLVDLLLECVICILRDKYRYNV